jgi:fucose 4-O-acetylase-like acetyltransferase
MVSNEKVYNQTADVFKGALILFVIIGHVLLGTLVDNPIRFFIYTFHMPVFFFIGGYLLNLPKLEKMDWLNILKKYTRRMLAVWAMACVVYALLVDFKRLSWQLLFDRFLHPYYHLWFIPT